MWLQGVHGMVVVAVGKVIGRVYVRAALWIW